MDHLQRDGRNLSLAEQDYLKAIHALSGRHGRATTTEIACRLNIRPASVTGMIQKLARTDPPLVAYRKHGGATLTAVGRRAALAIIRRHRLLEMYLCQKLGYNWEEAHEEAEALGHVVSTEMIARIAALLGYPSVNPQGVPIPAAEPGLPSDGERPSTT